MQSAFENQLAANQLENKKEAPPSRNTKRKRFLFSRKPEIHPTMGPICVKVASKRGHGLPRLFYVLSIYISLQSGRFYSMVAELGSRRGGSQCRD